MKYFTKAELEDITNSLLENPSYETLKELNNKYNKVVEEVVPTTPTEVSDVAPLEEAPVLENTNTETMPSLEMPSQELVNPEIQNIENIPNLEAAPETVSVPSMEASPEVVPTPEMVNNVEQPVQNFGMPEVNQNVEVPAEEPIATPGFEVPVEQGTPVMENSFPNVTEPVQEAVSIPSLDIPSGNNGNIEVTGPSIENNNQSSPVFQNINLNNIQNQASMPVPENNVQNTNFEQNSGVVPFDGNLWAPNTPDASTMMQPTENFNNNMTNNMNMPQNNQMPNQTQQYQSGPSMFSQLQNTYQ